MKSLTVDRDALYTRLLLDDQTAAVYINDAETAGRAKHGRPTTPVLITAWLNFTGKVAMVETHVAYAPWRDLRGAIALPPRGQQWRSTYRKLMGRRIPLTARESRTAVIDYIFSVASARQLDAMWAAVGSGV